MTYVSVVILAPKLASHPETSDGTSASYTPIKCVDRYRVCVGVMLPEIFPRPNKVTRKIYLVGNRSSNRVFYFQGLGR